jgi:thioredoxin 1
MCKQQKPIVDRLSQDPAFKDVTVFTVDFDSSKELLRRWKVAQQGTLIAFKGKTETLRSTGDVEPDAIRKVFQAAL